MTTIWTPEDDFRRYFPRYGERLDRLPFADLAQHALDTERELQNREEIELSIKKGAERSEANLRVAFPYGESIDYMLIASHLHGVEQRAWWRAIGFTPA